MKLLKFSLKLKIKKSNLTESEREQIIGLYKGGCTISNISKSLKFATTVSKTIKNFLERDSVKELPRSGRIKMS